MFRLWVMVALLKPAHALFSQIQCSQIYKSLLG